MYSVLPTPPCPNAVAGLVRSMLYIYNRNVKNRDFCGMHYQSRLPNASLSSSNIVCKNLYVHLVQSKCFMASPLTGLRRRSKCHRDEHKFFISRGGPTNAGARGVSLKYE